MSPVIKDREGNIFWENEGGMKAREGFDKDTNNKDIKDPGKDTHTHTRKLMHTKVNTESSTLSTTINTQWKQSDKGVWYLKETQLTRNIKIKKTKECTTPTKKPISRTMRNTTKKYIQTKYQDN